MPKFCFYSFAKRGIALCFVFVWLAPVSGVMGAEIVGPKEAQSREGLSSAKQDVAEAEKLYSEWKSPSFKLAA